MIRAVLFDVGGVLVHPNWERVAETLARRGVVVEPAALAAADAPARREADLRRPGEASLEDEAVWPYFAAILRHAGQAVTPAVNAALLDLRRSHDEGNVWEVPSAGAPDVLSQLRDAGLLLAVVSNANGTVRAMLERLGLARFFGTIVDSHEEGVEKPDPRIFRAALDRIGARPEHAVHVGDLYTVDVAGARGAGLAAILYDPFALYEGADVARVRDLAEIPRIITDGGLQGPFG